MNFDSNHHLEHKRSVVRTLTHRTRSIVSDLGERNEELDHVRRAMGYNGYPDWLLTDTREDVKENTREKVLTSGAKSEERKKRPVVVPYIREFSEELKRIFGGFGVPTYFKSSNTLRQLLVHPKDPVGKDKVVGPVYKISCEECDATYVDETERSLKARFGEHRRPSSTTSKVSKHIHTDNPNHNITLENTKILSVEHKWFERGVKEAIYIRAMNPSLNRDGGCYNMPPVWNNIIKERVTDGTGTTNGGGAGLRNSVSVPIVSNTIWRLRHTDEGCSDSRKLCKCCQTFYPV